MTSKLDYLSKYYQQSSNTKNTNQRDYDDDDYDVKKMKKQRKKELKKSKKRKHSNNNDYEDVIIKDDDDDDDDNDMSNNHNNDDFDNEHGPVIVENVQHVATTVTTKTNKSFKQPLRKRYDSDDYDDSDDDNDNDYGNNRYQKKSNKKYTKKRIRHDSSRSSSSSSNNNNSDSNDKNDHQEHKRSSRKRYDSDDEDSNPSSNDSDSNDDSRISSNNDWKKAKKKKDKKKKNIKMSSGHKAGLQSSTQFTINENKIQLKKKRSMVGDNYDKGDTIYRNQHGKRTNNLHDNQQDDDPMSTVDFNIGKAQMQQMEEQYMEKELLKQSTFSRSVNDVDQYKRNVIRKGDPMAMAALAKHGGDSTSGATIVKKVYKGPPPKPNRYGIQPGYRWDGIDRGNGFEDSVLAMLYGRGHKEEARYKWSVSDM